MGFCFGKNEEKFAILVRILKLSQILNKVRIISIWVSQEGGQIGFIYIL